MGAVTNKKEMTSKSIKTEKTTISEKNLLPAGRYAESLITVWLDTGFQTNNHSTKTIEQLQKISNDVALFHDSDVCIDYITDSKNEHVLFIVSDSTHACILTLAQDLPAVSTLYIMCSSEAANYGRSFESIRKMNGTFYCTHDLIKQTRMFVHVFATIKRGFS